MGSGAFSTVTLAQHGVTGLPVALKRLSRELIDKLGTAPRVRAEVLHLRLLAQHRHVTHLYDIVDDPASPTLDLVMEFVGGGDMYDLVQASSSRRRTRGRTWWGGGGGGGGVGGLADEEARLYFQQIVSALRHMHSRGVVHRDLKLENVLIDSTGKNCKIADLGLSARMGWEGGRWGRLRTPCGSPHYAAPELLSGQPYAGPPVDVWAAGTILYAMMSAKLPFVCEDLMEQFLLMREGIYKMPSHFTGQVRSLVGGMITVDVEDRLTLDQVTKLPWFRVRLAPYLMVEMGSPPDVAQEGDDENKNRSAEFRRKWQSVRDDIIDEVVALYAAHTPPVSRAALKRAVASDQFGLGGPEAAFAPITSAEARAMARAKADAPAASPMDARREAVRDAQSAYHLLLDASNAEDWAAGARTGARAADEEGSATSHPVESVEEEIPGRPRLWGWGQRSVVASQ